MKVLVTGGAGFIGSHTAQALLDGGHEVSVLDNLSTGHKANLPKGVRFTEGDIRNETLIKTLAKRGFEAVVHLAAQVSVAVSVREFERDAAENILGTLHLARLCETTGAKLVFASSGGTVYGEVETTASEDHPLDPRSPYGLSKLTAERYIRMVLPQEQAVVLRYGNVYGPRQDPHGEAGVVAIFSKRLLAGEPCALNGGGVCVRDYVFVEDVVQANLLALTAPGGGTFNIGSGKATDVKKIFDLLNKAGQFGVQAADAPFREGDLMRAVLNIRSAKKHLGYQPKVDLKEGVAKTLDYFREQQPKARR